jgi:hypothetical protein
MIFPWGNLFRRKNPSRNYSLYYSDELHMRRYKSPHENVNIPREIEEE